MTSESMPLSDIVSPKCRRIHEKVVRLAEHLLKLAEGSDEGFLSRSASLSAWSVGQHLDHVAKANLEMAGAIRKILDGDAGPSRPRPTVVGRAILSSGWIPRGVGQAPDYTRPEAASADQIVKNLRKSLAAVRELEDSLPEIDRSRGRADHFAFGGLCPMRWLRVMDVHTRHHLKIIRDIERGR